MTTKTQMNAFFRAMRKAGIWAKQNFSCCSGCGYAELGERAREQGKWAQPVAFYNQQAEPDWQVNAGEHFETVLRRGFWLTFGVVNTGSMTRRRHAQRTTEVGCQIKALAAEHGIKIDWNGDPRLNIHVLGWRDEEEMMKAGAA